MIENINAINPAKSAIAAITSAGAGSFSKYFAAWQLGFLSLETVNIFFQQAAWIVAILAGIVSIINGVRQWHVKKKKIK